MKTEIPATGRVTLVKNEVTAISLSDLEAVYGRPDIPQYRQDNDYDFDDEGTPRAFATFFAHHSDGSLVTQAEQDIVDVWAIQIDVDSAAVIRGKIATAAADDVVEAVREGRERRVWDVPEPVVSQAVRDVVIAARKIPDGSTRPE